MAKKQYSYNDHSPFIVRRPYLRLWHMILFGFVMTLTIYSSIYYASEQFRDFVVILFGIFIVILFYFIQNTYFDDKTASEFQSSVYSGAMRASTMLTFILHQDCSVFYFDQRYLNEFSEASSLHNFDQIIEVLGVGDKTKETMVDAIDNGRQLEVKNIFFDGKKRTSVVIGIYPIARPKGFVNMSIYKVS